MKKKIFSTLMVLTVATVSVSAPLAALADEYSDKISEQETKINDLKNQEATVAAKLEKINTNINNIQTEAAELQQKQVELNQEIETLQKEIEDLGTRIEKREESLKKQARSVQQNGTASNYLDAVLNANSLSDAIGRVSNINKMVSANRELMEQQQTDKEAVETKQDDTEAKLTEVNDNALVLEQKLDELNTQQLEQAIFQADLAARRTTEEGKKAEYEQQKAEAERRKAEQEEANRLAEENRQAELANTAAASVSTGTTANSSVASDDTTVSGGTSSSSSNAGSTWTSSVVTEAPAAPANAGGIVATAYSQIGKPYVWGATGPSSFDCSGLVQYVFSANGISLPRTTYAQEYAGTMISIDQLQAGDLVFFGSRGSTYHVGIYIGGGQYIHAPEPGDNVKITSISGYTPSFGVRVG